MRSAGLRDLFVNVHKPPDVARHVGLVRESTPHMDDFDAPEALAAAMMVSEALECCSSLHNSAKMIQSSLSGMEAVMPEDSLDPDDQPRSWRKSAVRKEVRRQLWLVEQIGGLDKIDDHAIQNLRRALARPDLAGEAPLPETTGGPAKITNQQAFEQYRRTVESDIKTSDTAWMNTLQDPDLKMMLLFSQWASRYSRRRQTISGEYGKLADTLALQALVALNRARDAADPQPADWSRAEREMIDLYYQNTHNHLDASSADQAHGFGPSPRRLWLEARRGGLTGEQAWRKVAAWAQYRPPAWETEDRRKKKGQAHANTDLGRRLAQVAAWEPSGDPAEPWTAMVGGENWRVRLNDFPDDLMYSLLINGQLIGSFHDWPETWSRD